MVGLDTLFSTLASRVAHSLQGQLQTQLRNAVNQVQSFSANSNSSRPQSPLQPSKIVERIGQIQNPFQVAQQAFSQRWSQFRAERTEERLRRAKEAYDDNRTPDTTREYSRAMRANYRAQQQVQQVQGMPPAQTLLQMYQTSRPMAAISRAAALQDKAEERVDKAIKHRDAMQNVLTQAQQAFANYPAPGQQGHDPQTFLNLGKDTSDASKNVKMADAGVVNALSKLSQATTLYARSTNVAAGAMRFVGAGLVKAIPYVGTAIAVGSAATSIPGIIRDIGQNRLESNRWMAGYSGTQNAAYAEFDVNQEKRRGRVSRGTADTNKRFVGAFDRFMDSLTELQIPISNTLNTAGAGVLEGSAGFLDNSRKDPVGTTWKMASTLMPMLDPIGLNKMIIDAVREAVEGKKDDRKDPAKHAEKAAMEALAEEKAASNNFSGTLGAAAMALRARIDTRKNMKPKEFLGDLKKK